KLGTYRIARLFEIESGHRLSKHPEKCRFPHGHTRRIEVVLRADALDGNDMVCDYKALKTVVVRELERFDHAMLLAASDPLRDAFAPFAERVVLLEEGDPTTEVLARHLFGAVNRAFRPGMEVRTPGGATYRVPDTVRLERIRVWETPHTWGEYGEEPGTGDSGPGAGE
ncbi:MAG TPA: 6-carboxytetrahydropterin synthase, partial [Thermoanaerobaculaceae bacterium]|nr:6-carboxytetrahydropterin synthase [Thermoanaerobaculaceae bacterium]